jgi:branched-chain amino acid transport system ATP-binding protein/urea transport system ATP-binding protein
MAFEWLLQTEGLTMRFGGVVAVNDVTFRLADGELRCLIGPNGAGKSTFFKCLTGQLTPTAGAVLFDGRPITGLHSHEIARLGVGIKTQTPNLFNGLDARENVWLAASRAHLPGQAARLVDEALERFGIGALARRVVGELAHGQRQLVELACVAAAQPRLILLDEPAAGMTDEEVARIVAIIKEINRTTAVVVVEHDMHFIRQIARTVTVFHQGAVLVEDHVDAVLANPRVRDVYLGKKAA